MTRFIDRAFNSPSSFGADALLQGDVLDDGKHRVDHVAGTAQNGQEPGGKRSQDGDALWMRTQEFLRELHHHFEAPRLLQRSRTADDGNDGQHHVHRWLARSQAEDEDHDDKADTGDKVQTEAAVAGAENSSPFVRVSALSSFRGARVRAPRCAPENRGSRNARGTCAPDSDDNQRPRSQ